MLHDFYRRNLLEYHDILQGGCINDTTMDGVGEGHFSERFRILWIRHGLA